MSKYILTYNLSVNVISKYFEVTTLQKHLLFLWCNYVLQFSREGVEMCFIVSVPTSKQLSP